MIELSYQYHEFANDWFLLMVLLSTVWLWVTSVRPELQLNKTSHSNESTTPYQSWRVYIFIYPWVLEAGVCHLVPGVFSLTKSQMTSQHFRAVLAGAILVSDFCPGPLFAHHKIFQQKMLEGLDAFAGENASGVSFFCHPQYTSVSTTVQGFSTCPTHPLYHFWVVHCNSVGQFTT